jgi:hypothetical protein
VSRQRRLYEARTPPGHSRHPAAHGDVAPREEPTPSQLDRIAEVNARANRQARGSRAVSLATATGVAVLIGLAGWWGLRPVDVGVPAQAPKPIAAPGAAVQVAPPTFAMPVPAAAPAVPQALATEMLVQGTAASAALSPSVPDADRTRRARARLEAEARAKATQRDEALARARADEQDRERREAERARELAAQAAPPAAEPAPQRIQPAAEPRREVKALCAASGNFLSENFCQSRECRKAEHRDDATCVRLKELEEARLSGSQR